MNNGDPLFSTTRSACCRLRHREHADHATLPTRDNPANVRDRRRSDGPRPRAARLLAEPDPEVNLLSGGRRGDANHGQFFHNTLITQISLRSLAFVDRYR
jgi:hypothetical protein